MEKTINAVPLLLLLVALAVGASPVAVHADDDWLELHREVEAGRILALPTVLNRLEADYIGQVVEVEFERDDGRAIYEIEMIGPDGQIVEFEVDAETGELMSIEGSNIRGMTRQ